MNENEIAKQIAEKLFQIEIDLYKEYDFLELHKFEIEKQVLKQKIDIVHNIAMSIDLIADGYKKPNEIKIKL